MANKLSLDVIFNATDKVTGPLKAIIGGSDKLSKSVDDTTQKLKDLEQQQRKIARYQQLQQTIDRNTQKLREYQNILHSLSKSQDAGPVNESTVRKLRSYEDKIARVNQQLDKQKDELATLDRYMHQNGLNVQNLADEEVGLKNQINQTTKELYQRRDALDKVTQAQQRYQKTQAILAKGKDIAQKGMIAAGIGAAALTVPAKLSIDYESAFADVKKVVNGTDAEYKNLSQEIINMSTRLPMAANDLAAIVASGGQSGIAKNELTKFAETAAKMGVAFDIPAEQAGQSMAELRTAFRMSQDQVTTLADQINYLGNNTAAAAPSILEIVQRIGPLGEVGGYTASSIAALGATLKGMGVGEEIAATGIKNMMLALVAGESATKSQKAVWKDLGLDFVKVSKDMQVNAEATTLKVLQSIAKLPKDQQASALSGLFGKESIGAIAPLLTNMATLKTNLDMVADAQKYGGSMNAEYAARAATTANNIQLLKNQVSALGINIGNALLPQINAFLQRAGDIINKVITWTQANPQLTATLTKAAVGAVALVGGVSALSLGVLTALGPLAMLKKSVDILGGGMGILSTAVKIITSPLKLLGSAVLFVGKSFLVAGRFMMANPIILAVTLVATAAYLIYKNWEPIKTFFIDIWGKVKNAFSTGIGYIKNIISSVDSVFANNPILHILFPIIGIPRLIIANWSSISAFFGGIWSAIVDKVNIGVSKVSAIVGTLSAWLAVKWNEIKNNVSAAWAIVCNIFLNSPLVQYVIRNFDQIKAVLRGLPNEFLQLGKNMIDGLINGIKSGFEKLKPLWDKINSYMPDFMRKKMNIHSPSRLMKKMGGYIMDGLTIGIDNGIAGLKTAYNKAMDVLQQSPTVQKIQAMPAVQHAIDIIKNPSQTLDKIDGVLNGTQQLPLPKPLRKLWDTVYNAIPEVGKPSQNSPLSLFDKANSILERFVGGTPRAVTAMPSPSYSGMQALTASSAPSASTTTATRGNNITINSSDTININLQANDQSLIKRLRQELERHEREKSAIIRRHLTDRE